jgi:hypothetical protein
MNLSQYHDDMIQLLESKATSNFIIIFFAKILKFDELSYSDVLYLLDNYLAYCYDCTSSEKDKRKYSNIDTIVHDSIVKYHYINSYIDSIQADIEHIQEYIKELHISDSLYNKLDKLDDMLCDVIHEFNETSL